jgi:hypothetical protein
MTPEERQQFQEMYNWFKQMQFSHSVPRSTEMALRERLKDMVETELFDSSVNPNTKEQVLVNDPGGTLVPQVFSGFDTNEAGTKLYPYYTP